MKYYLSMLWMTLCGRSCSAEYIVLTRGQYAELVARIAKYDRRAAAQRKARAARVPMSLRASD